MKLLTNEQHAKLLGNGRRQATVKGTRGEIDFHPVVKLFFPASGATWLLTELEPDQPDTAWGLCDLGIGSPEYGTVLLSELAAIRGYFNLPVERDLHWSAKGPISAYIAAARTAGRIVDLPVSTAH